MHGRSCRSLLAVWLLTLCSSPHCGVKRLLFLRDQRRRAGSGPDAARAAVVRSLGWLDAPSPQAARHFAGLGSASGGAPTFPQLARTAGTIFAGTVTKIEAGPAAGGSAGPTVAITFQVEHLLRGSLPGGSLAILEWLGLSSSGQRYAIGEHVLLFLYPRANLAS
jgi:hypothetical protein